MWSWGALVLSQHAGFPFDTSSAQCRYLPAGLASWVTKEGPRVFSLAVSFQKVFRKVVLGECLLGPWFTPWFPFVMGHWSVGPDWPQWLPSPRSGGWETYYSPVVVGKFKLFVFCMSHMLLFLFFSLSSLDLLSIILWFHFISTSGLLAVFLKKFFSWWFFSTVYNILL